MVGYETTFTLMSGVYADARQEEQVLCYYIKIFKIVSVANVYLKRKITVMSLISNGKLNFQLWRDNLRRSLGVYLFDRVKKPLTNKKNHLVIIRWDAKLGDAIVSSWFLREIKRSHPEMSVTVITTAQMAGLFKEFFFADNVIPIEKRPSYTKLKSVAAQLGEVDYLIHLSKRLKMKDIYFINKASASHVVGLDDELDCIDIKLGYKTQGVHFSDKFASIMDEINMVYSCNDYIIPYISSSEDAVNMRWPSDSKVACFNPYGSGGARQLNKDNIVLITKILSEEFGFKICILFPPDKMLEVNNIVSEINSDVFIYPDTPTIGIMIAQIRRCDLLVSVDTATIHIASGLHKMTLGIYNPDMENYNEWGPNNNNAKVIFSTKKETPSVNNFDVVDLRTSLMDMKNDIN